MIKNILIGLLILIAIAMIILGIKAEILPPILTGFGFIIIATIFYNQYRNR